MIGASLPLSLTTSNLPNSIISHNLEQAIISAQDISGGVIISDAIVQERSINIFAGFTRDIQVISQRLEDDTQNTTVLAPLNSALQKLPRKPWQDPQDYKSQGSSAYVGDGGVDKAHANLQRFVEAHIIPASPWEENEKVESLAGEKVWWTRDGDKKMIQPGNIEVSSIASRVANGEVWVLKGALNYE
ncbi:MAG: hypothetical protein MMC33_005647 [Icmadophila ericetorum]|nr:hypothetical protein [Icmadophila ericetorum]